MALFIALLLCPVAWAWEGFVFMTLWAWFVVPLGMPAIALAHAVGLAAMPGLFHYARKKDDPPADLEWLIWVLFVWILRPGFALLVGAIAHAFLA